MTYAGSRYRWMLLLLCLAINVRVFASVPLYYNHYRTDQGSPLYAAANITAETVSNLSGGLDTGTDFNGLAYAEFSVNGPVIGLPEGGRFHVSAVAIAGGAASPDLIGDFQVASNIEAPSSQRLYDLWFRQDFDALPLQLRLGIIDLNSYFNVTESALALINSSFAIGAALSANAPFSIYPEPGFGVMARYGMDNARLLTGVFSGDPQALNAAFDSGLLVIAEWQQSLWQATRFHMGAWKCDCTTHSGSPAAFNTYGVYGSLEHRVIDVAVKPFTLFLRAASGHGAGRIVKRSFGLGINFQGIFSSRPEDIFSAGITQARFNSGPPETSHELTYLLQFNKRIAIQADYQYIRNPSGRLAAAHAFIFRVNYAFESHFQPDR